MKVRDLCNLLAQCDPDAEVIVNAPFGAGFVSVNAVLRRGTHPATGTRLPTVEPLMGDLAHMRGQGMDVLGLGNPEPCTCTTCRKQPK